MGAHICHGEDCPAGPSLPTPGEPDLMVPLCLLPLRGRPHYPAPSTTCPGALVLSAQLGARPHESCSATLTRRDEAAPRPACCVYCEEGPERRQRFCYTTRPSQTRLSRSARVHAENVCCTVVTTALTQEPGHGLDILSHLSKQITTHTRHKTLQGH